MSHLLEKCAVCGALLDEEDLFCANCGTEAPDRARAGAEVPAATHSFLCAGCGASMAYDASVQALRCPFCGSEQLAEQPESKSLAAKWIVPFQIDRTQASTVLRAWLGRGFWRPGDLAQAAVVDKTAAVYVPYWVFEAHTYTYWTADSSQTPFGARGNWVPLSGEHRGSYAGVLIGASGVLTQGETAALCPFDLARAQPPEAVPREGTIIEQFRVPRKYARPSAQHGLEDLEHRACQPYVPGRCRNLKVNVRLEGLSSEPVLLPVWMVAYRYRDSVFRFLLNGQTGRATGQAPISWTKVIVAIAIVALIALVLFLGLAGVAALSARDWPAVCEMSLAPEAQAGLRSPAVRRSPARTVPVPPATG
jgi:DNA-directed RNA polymerase subunit RPC12/RpoP